MMEEVKKIGVDRVKRKKQVKQRRRMRILEKSNRKEKKRTVKFEQ